MHIRNHNTYTHTIKIPRNTQDRMHSLTCTPEHPHMQFKTLTHEKDKGLRQSTSSWQGQLVHTSPAVEACMNTYKWGVIRVRSYDSFGCVNACFCSTSCGLCNCMASLAHRFLWAVRELCRTICGRNATLSLGIWPKDLLTQCIGEACTRECWCSERTGSGWYVHEAWKHQSREDLLDTEVMPDLLERHGLTEYRSYAWPAYKV